MACVLWQHIEYYNALLISEVIKYILCHTYTYIVHRASYFSLTPTDKMYSVVAAAKALYDQLGDLGETSIDGDAFLDLWIYVIIKANIKDLVSDVYTVAHMYMYITVHSYVAVPRQDSKSPATDLLDIPR